jgi:hypothetical protein
MILAKADDDFNTAEITTLVSPSITGAISSYKVLIIPHTKLRFITTTYFLVLP